MLADVRAAVLEGGAQHGAQALQQLRVAGRGAVALQALQELGQQLLQLAVQILVDFGYLGEPAKINSIYFYFTASFIPKHKNLI